MSNALQLEAARATPLTPAFSHFNYDAMPSVKSLNLCIIAFFAADTLLYAVTLTFDL